MCGLQGVLEKPRRRRLDAVKAFALERHEEHEADSERTSTPWVDKGPVRNLEAPAMAEKTLDILFHDTLRDIYYAERAILKALPKLKRGAQAPELKQAFDVHKAETEVHGASPAGLRDHRQRPRDKTCPAIDGILGEGEEILAEYEGRAGARPGLIVAAQAVEHYEITRYITRYGTLKRWAEVLGLQEAAALWDATLQEEIETDETLTVLTDAAANQKAIAAE
jgi:ferritin-like metal-binding protein YciE